MENSRAKILSPATGGSAEIVQEVGKSRVACRVCIINLPQKVRVGSLRRQLPQELDAVTKRMASAQFRLRLLKQQVVCLLGLQQIRRNPGRCDGRDRDARQRARRWSGLGRNYVVPAHPLPCIGETELVGPARREGVMVREEKILISVARIEDEAGKIDGGGRGRAGVTDVAKRQPVRLREVVIQPRQPLRPSIGPGRASGAVANCTTPRFTPVTGSSPSCSPIGLAVPRRLPRKLR